jgi:tetratricopeptide (TPR) repeat protein
MFLGRQQAAYARLDDEHANTRAVIEWATREQRLPCASALIGSHFMFWIARGHVTEALPWVASALRARGKVDDDSWTAMLVGAGEIYRASGHATMAVALKEELLERYRACEPSDPVAVPATLVNLSDLAMQAGDLVRARELAEQSLQLRIERGLNPARSLSTLGQLALCENDLGAAERLFEEAHRGFVVLQDENNAASTRASLGKLARLRGDHSTAGDLLREALTRSEALGNKQLMSDCLQELATLARSQGELERAARLWGAGQALRCRGGIAPLIDGEMTALPAALQREGAALSIEDAISLASSHDR